MKIAFDILVTCILIFYANYAYATCGGSTSVVDDTYTAYDLSYDCVALAFSDAATAGYNKTVILPSGEVTWPSLSKITINKAVSVIGAGVENTIITSGGGDGTTNTTNSLFVVSPDETSAVGNYLFKISGIEFRYGSAGSSLYDILYIGGANTSVATKNIIINNNKFVGYGNGMGIIQSRNIFGIVHNNIFINLSHAWRLLVSNTDGWTKDEEWVPGSNNAMYYEDNDLVHETGCILVSGGRGLRMTARYNRLDSETGCFPNFDIHGIQVAAGIGYELYGNLGINQCSLFLGQRGGQVFMFGNYWPNDIDAKFETRTEWHSDYNEGLDANPSTSYKTTALGNYDQNVHWSYYWSNYVSSGGVSNSFTPYVLTAVEDTFYRDGPNNDPLTIVENQSHWVHRPNVDFTGAVAEIGSCGQYGQSECTASGVGCGTLANRPQTCTAGVAYWATDQSCTDLTGMAGKDPITPISGTLYKCTSTDTWEEYYKPYVYPHPLRRQFRSDLDVDDDVDIFDYNTLIGNFGTTNDCNKPDADLDCDVDIFDYNILLGEFGSGT